MVRIWRAARERAHQRRRHPSRPARRSVVLGAVAVLVLALPVTVAWPSLRAAETASTVAAQTAVEARAATALRAAVSDFKHASEGTLVAVQEDDTAAIGEGGSEMLLIGEELQAAFPEVVTAAYDRGQPQLADAVAAAGEDMAAAAEENLPAFNAPGTDTTAQRARAWASAVQAEDALTALAEALEASAAASADTAEAAYSDLRRGLAASSAVAALVVAVTTLVLRRRFLGDHRAHLLVEEARDEELARNSFEMELRSGLEMVSTETDAHAVIDRGLERVASEHCTDLLMADSSRTHFEHVAGSAGEGCDGCAVPSPSECPAVRRGHRLVFESSDALDACPYLRDRQQGTVGAVCIPMSIGSRTSGVVHVATPAGATPPPATVALLETLARAASDRVGMLRAMARSEAQAATDPLTGLLNRRSLDDKAQELIRRERPFTAAFGDLDHFKMLNDLHGHDTGDRALRFFSRILAMETRPGDIVARYGGEEFLVLLPDCGPDETLQVLARVRSRLEDQIPRANLPHFTMSFGVSEWDRESELRTVVDRADQALLRAKAEGRDRDVVADDLPRIGGAPDVPDAEAAAGVEVS